MSKFFTVIFYIQSSKDKWTTQTFNKANIIKNSKLRERQQSKQSLELRQELASTMKRHPTTLRLLPVTTALTRPRQQDFWPSRAEWLSKFCLKKKVKLIVQNTEYVSRNYTTPFLKNLARSDIFWNVQIKSLKTVICCVHDMEGGVCTYGEWWVEVSSLLPFKWF